ncbi:hypothetical protein JCM17961_44960 [Endothiovibrio diazotrophicus]
MAPGFRILLTPSTYIPVGNRGLGAAPTFEGRRNTPPPDSLRRTPRARLLGFATLNPTYEL